MPCGARGAGDDTPNAPPFGRYGSGGAARCMATRRRDRDAAGGDDEPSCDQLHPRRAQLVTGRRRLLLASRAAACHTTNHHKIRAVRPRDHSLQRVGKVGDELLDDAARGTIRLLLVKRVDEQHVARVEHWRRAHGAHFVAKEQVKASIAQRDLRRHRRSQRLPPLQRVGKRQARVRRCERHPCQKPSARSSAIIVCIDLAEMCSMSRQIWRSKCQPCRIVCLHSRTCEMHYAWIETRRFTLGIASQCGHKGGVRHS